MSKYKYKILSTHTHTDLNLLINICLDELHYALLYNDDRNKKKKLIKCPQGQPTANQIFYFFLNIFTLIILI